MNLDYLKTYLELVKLGSFSEVAKKLAISQPAVSFQIQKLEHDLGVRLINRGQKKITVTDAGKRLLKFANMVIGETNHLLDDLDRLRQEVTGELAIAASTIPSEFLLPPILSQFMTLHPAVTARVETHDSLAIIAGVQDGSYEVGFCGTLPPRSQGLELFKVAEDEIALIVSREHPLAKRRRVSFTELEGEPFIFREPTSGTQRSLEGLLSQAGFDIRRLSQRLIMGNTQAVVSAVEAGAGIGFVSNLAIKKSLELGLTCQLKLEELNLRRDFFCIYYRDRLLSRLFDEFLSFVRMKTITGPEV
jgi:DNA-binding transcriptional LysR family regulator